jgi:hypothetical protein
MALVVSLESDAGQGDKDHQEHACAGGSAQGASTASPPGVACVCYLAVEAQWSLWTFRRTRGCRRLESGPSMPESGGRGPLTMLTRSASRPRRTSSSEHWRGGAVPVRFEAGGGRQTQLCIYPRAFHFRSLGRLRTFSTDGEPFPGSRKKASLRRVYTSSADVGALLPGFSPSPPLLLAVEEAVVCLRVAGQVPQIGHSTFTVDT